ncbi:DUF6232 family protein [Actinoplanes sp. NPDC020271]|uniref:DUF6232 family protein n=1 Tax=Actinoplanes sp. NPDC020271 TaxID=3363896 RepID=UPI0037AF8EF1
MPVFYRGPRALITHRVIEVPSRARQAFALRQLSRIQAVEEGQDSDATRYRAVGVSAVFTVIGVVPVLGRASVPLAAVVALALVVCAGACLRVRPRSAYRLLALVGGQLVILVETEDRQEFDQIVRGLIRALDYHAGGN